MTMPIDPRQAHWDSVYSTKAPDEVSWHQARPGVSLELIERTGKGRDARIIDVGGGASRLVDALLDEGFERVTVLDISPEALARARERLGDRARRVTWETADVSRWKSPATYDIWHDRAVFHFLVEPEDRRSYREAMAAALPRGGQAIIGTFASDGPERCSGLPVARYEPETLAAELGPGFRLVESTHEDHRTPTGKVQRFQFSRFVREEAPVPLSRRPGPGRT
jgi:SAM-dependent methyltransferase